MGHHKQPGITSQLTQPFDVDDGTMCRVASPTPGNTGWFGPEAEDYSPLEILFRMCLAHTAGISENAYQTAARQLEVEVEAIKAVAIVESSRQGFDDYGRPTILFERHYFHRLTSGKYDAQAPTVSNKKAGGYGKYSTQYTKLEEAFALAPEAALKSASWGRFQIMGANYAAAGFDSVKAFVLALIRSEDAHLSAFVNFVKSDKKMLKALQDKDWAAFARKYNGPGYQKNQYDTKIQKEYDRLKNPAPSAKN